MDDHTTESEIQHRSQGQQGWPFVGAAATGHDATSAIPFSAMAQALYADVPGLIEVRAVPPKRRGAEVAFFPPGDGEGWAAWCRARRGANLYFGVATRRSSHGGTLDDCQALPCLFCDLDFKSLGETATREQIAAFPLSPTLTIHSGAGLHVYWFLKEWVELPTNATTAKAYLRGVALALNGDMVAAEPARVLRIPGGFNRKYDPPPLVRVEHFDPAARYNLGEFDEWVPLATSTTAARPSSAITVAETVPNGRRNDTLYRLGRALRAKRLPAGITAETLRQVNERQCDPPLEADEIETVVDEVLGEADRPDFRETEAPSCPIRTWPDPPDPVVYRTTLGAYVQTLAPYTEADPTAILAQLLAMFGNAIGRGPHFRVGADRHHLVLNVGLVGPTASGRKGMSANEAKRALTLADPEWASTCVITGLSSGEGLIWAVRDPVETQMPLKEKGHIIGYDTVIGDHGVEDKRLLVVETEFARTLRVMSRNGSTLSAVIRQAYDGGDLRVLTKNSPVKATGAHIAIICHITRHELLRELGRAELGNGFTNRFLWMCVQRSKCLPEGGQVPEADLAVFAHDFTLVLDRARRVGEMTRTPAAKELWASIYPALTAGRPGLLGAVTSRAEVNTARLACLYALADEYDTVDVPHVESALGMWRYAEASATFIFGDGLGDPDADAILSALRQRPGGLTRTEINNVLLRNKTRAEINRALGVLAENGLAQMKPEKTAGRPTERWTATL